VSLSAASFHAATALGQGAAPKLQIAWQQQIPLPTAPLQVADGAVRTFDGSNVRTFDLATGASSWTVQPPPATGQALLMGCCQTGAAPSESGLYTLAGGNQVWALDARDGAVRWRQRLGDALLAPPAATAGTVGGLSLEGAEIILDGLDAGDGAPLWSVHLQGQVLPLLAASNGTFFVSLASGAIAAFAASDGQKRWVSAADTRASLITPQQISAGLLVQPTDRGLLGLDPATGQTLWTSDLPAVPLEPRVVGDSVYVRAIDGTVSAVNAGDGTLRWQAQVGRQRTLTLSGPTAGLLLVAGEGGVAAMDATTGQQMWEWTAEPVDVAPVRADGVVYVVSAPGDLVVLDAGSGVELTRLALGGPVFDNPTLAPDGSLLVTTEGRSQASLVAITGKP